MICSDTNAKKKRRQKLLENGRKFFEEWHFNLNQLKLCWEKRATNRGAQCKASTVANTSEHKNSTVPHQTKSVYGEQIFWFTRRFPTHNSFKVLFCFDFFFVCCSYVFFLLLHVFVLNDLSSKSTNLCFPFHHVHSRYWNWKPQRLCAWTVFSETKTRICLRFSCL